jgi:prefoldin subunit 5
MAIRIPILTSFDPKGLKQANAQFAKLQTSMGSLGRNFAAAGVVIAGAFTMIGKSVMDAAEAQKVFAQTEAVLKSTGTTANGTAVQIQALASSLQKSTAFNDEAILAGQNLLLTFKGVRNEVGEGNDIFDQASATMLDFARATNTDASSAAIKLGKALQDPTRGVTALRKSGVDFTKDQMEMIKSLQESGDLMGAQKIVLAELQTQFGGSAAAYANTFSGQLESMNNELNDLSEEIGFMVMPAVRDMISEFRELIPIIGPQLKAAIQSVDWKGLITAIVDFTRYLVENATTIAKTIAAAFALSTAIKTITVAVQLGKVAMAIYTWSLAQMAAGTTITTIATKGLGMAMKALPWVAVAVAAASVGTELTQSGDKLQDYTKKLNHLYPAAKQSDRDMVALGLTVSDVAEKWNPALKVVNDFVKDLLKIPSELPVQIKLQVSSGYADAETRRLTEQAFGRGGLNLSLGKFDTNTTTTDTADKTGGGTRQLGLGETLKREATVVKKQAKLIGAGVSAGLAERLTSGAAPVKKANKALEAIRKNNGKLTKNLKNMEKNLKVVTDAATSSVAETTAAVEDTSVADALAAKENAYKSFADSVKNTFASIKDSIMSAFDLKELGGSTNAITRNMDKLLNRLRSFATNVKSLASMGLNPALLQQVISAGPMGGARLAEALVMGGASSLAAINAGYSEFGTLSGQIAQSGTDALFGTTAQQSIYNINVDGGVGSGSTIGKAIVDAIKAYERTSGAVWQGA